MKTDKKQVAAQPCSLNNFLIKSADMILKTIGFCDNKCKKLPKMQKKHLLTNCFHFRCFSFINLPIAWGMIKTRRKSGNLFSSILYLPSFFRTGPAGFCRAFALCAQGLADVLHEQPGRPRQPGPLCGGDADIPVLTSVKGLPADPVAVGAGA